MENAERGFKRSRPAVWDERSRKGIMTPMPRFRFLLILIVLLFFGVTSRRPAVVQLDLRYKFSDIEPSSFGDRRFLNLRVAGHHLVCGDLSPDGPGVAPDQWANASSVERLLSAPSGSSLEWTAEAQTMRHLAAAKTAWMTGQCFLFKSESDAYWIYDICVGRVIGQFHQSRQLSMSRGTYNSLGLYESALDQLFANGTIIQQYLNGTDGRRTELRLECSTNRRTSVISVQEDTPLDYRILITGPGFCDWRSVVPTQSSEMPSAEVEMPQDVPLSSLLYNLEGWCVNVTEGGWWSYEYCHPDSLTQFHTLPNTGEVDSQQIYLLGGLYPYPSISKGIPSHKAPLRKGDASYAAPAPSSSFIQLRSRWIHPPQPDDPVKWPVLPVSLVRKPTSNFGSLFNILGEPVKALRMEMSDGTLCGKKTYRQTAVYFSCPRDFRQYPHNRVVRIREVAYCRYELHISTPTICSHPELLPEPEPSPETVICYSEDSTDVLAEAAPDQPRRRFVGTAAENDLDVLQMEQDISSASWRKLRFTSVSNAVEMLPPSIAIPFGLSGSFSNISFDMFTLGHHIRYRTEKTSPKFRIGDVIRHASLEVRGAIIGWDLELKAPREWAEAYLQARKVSAYQPFYLILIDQVGIDPPLASPVMYSAQSELRRDSGDIHSPFLSRYFFEHSKEEEKFVVDSETEEGARLITRYPDDGVSIYVPFGSVESGPNSQLRTRSPVTAKDRLHADQMRPALGKDASGFVRQHSGIDRIARTTDAPTEQSLSLPSGAEADSVERTAKESKEVDSGETISTAGGMVVGAPASEGGLHPHHGMSDSRVSTALRDEL